MSTVKNFAFQVRGTDAIKSDRQYYIGSGLRFTGQLNPNTPSLALPYNPQENQEITNKIGKSYSYVDAIDAIGFNEILHGGSWPYNRLRRLNFLF